MALKVKFDKNASLTEQMAVVAKIRQDVIRAQSFVGEKFVTDCREQPQDHSQGTYLDNTGNLRASTGYFIRIDGKLEKTELKGSTGDAERAALRALDELPVVGGLQIIGIAGMNYASAVESKGYNVISRQADVALIDLTAKYKQIENKYK